MELIDVGQDEYDDGIMELVLTFSDNTKILQKWQWKDFCKEDGKGGSLHDVVMYDWKDFNNLTPEQKFTLISKLATQIEGPVVNENIVSMEGFKDVFTDIAKKIKNIGQTKFNTDVLTREFDKHLKDTLENPKWVERNVTFPIKCSVARMDIVEKHDSIMDMLPIWKKYLDDLVTISKAYIKYCEPREAELNKQYDILDKAGDEYTKDKDYEKAEKVLTKAVAAVAKTQDPNKFKNNLCNKYADKVPYKESVEKQHYEINSLEELDAVVTLVKETKLYYDKLSNEFPTWHDHIDSDSDAFSILEYDGEFELSVDWSDLSYHQNYEVPKPSIWDIYALAYELLPSLSIM